MKSGMSSRDRVFAALEGRIPDRVPVMELWVDPKVFQGIFPDLSYEDFIEQSDYYDAVYNLSALIAPEPDWVDEKKRIFRDKWGALQQFTEEALPLVLNPPRITCMEDLNTYEPPDPRDPLIMDSVKKMVERFKGNKAIVFVGEDAFAGPQYMRAGLENLLVDYRTEPALARKLAKIAEEYHVELYRNVIREGAEIIHLGDDYASNMNTLMSPADFDEFILPYLTTIVKEIKRAGAYCIKHTDGNIWSLLDRLAGTGLDALGPLQLSAGMDLAEVKRRCSRKITVMGNVEVDLLIRGTPDEVREATRVCIQSVSTGGRHILSSGNTISSGIPSENLKAMIETVREFGAYPINTLT